MLNVSMAGKAEETVEGVTTVYECIANVMAPNRTIPPAPEDGQGQRVQGDGTELYPG